MKEKQTKIEIQESEEGSPLTTHDVGKIYYEEGKAYIVVLEQKPTRAERAFGTGLPTTVTDRTDAVARTRGRNGLTGLRYVFKRAPELDARRARFQVNKDDS